MAVALVGGTALTAQSWLQLTPPAAPSPRNSAGFAYDDARGFGLLFGGYDAVAPGFGDTWRWDGANWQQLSPPFSPSPRWGHGLVFDRSRNRAVLFGGYDPVNGLRNDTWEWDGASWTLGITPAAPSVRTTAAMAFDRARGVTVLFGGSSPALMGDTWTWNGQAWTAHITYSAPLRRRNATVAFDDARQEVVLFGGHNGTAVLADTWTWNGTVWSQRSPAHSPAPQQAAAAAYDPQLRRIVMHGGSTADFGADFMDVWEWDGADWRVGPVAPAGRHGAGLVHDARRGALVLFGGRSGGFFADTWSLPSRDSAAMQTWTQTATIPVGSRVTSPAMAYDAGRGELILHGGSLVNGPPPWSPGGSYFWTTHTETWRWSVAGWSVIANGPARAGHGLVYDSLRGRLVLFGGYSGGQPFNFVDQQDTWAWNGTAWTQLATTGPSPRRAHGMAYDAARDRIVVFGGSGAAGTLADTWEWNGAAWNQVITLLSPSARSGLAATYDPTLARVVVFGGGSALGVFGDTWEFDGVTWTQSPGGGPPARSGHTLAFDAGQNRLVMFGGIASAPFDDTWARQGRSWSPAPCLGSPALRSGHAMAYDAGRQRMVVTLGQTSFADYPTTTFELSAQPLVGATLPAYGVIYGSGCGNPAPRFLPLTGSPPMPGASIRATIGDAPYNVWGSAPAFYSLGLSSLTSPIGPLPYPLALLGAPGCWLLQSADLGTFRIPTQISGSSYLLDLPLPNQPALLGLHVYGQAWVSQPSGGSSQLLVSNAIDWQIGNW